MERIEVITSVRRRRRDTGQEKAQFVAMTMQLGSSVSSVAKLIASKFRHHLVTTTLTGPLPLIRIKRRIFSLLQKPKVQSVNYSLKVVKMGS